MNLSKREEKAVRKSIEHWERMRNYTLNDFLDEPTENPDTDNCPLCCLYMLGHEIENECLHCPIFKKTGKTHCYGTPYNKVVNKYYRVFRTSKLVSVKAWERAADKMINFLESLLK